MAIAPEKIKNMKDHIREITEHIPGDAERKKFIVTEVLEKAFGETEELIDESRPPRLYVFGRSGAGKSSLINALANREVAETGSVEPETEKSKTYQISFSDRHASWDVIDSRGLFETVSPEGDVPADAVEIMQQDLEEYRPDILFHVITPDQVRAGKDDFKATNKLREEIGGPFPPVVYCLNKIDTHLSLGDSWPPEENPELAERITDNLDFVQQAIETQERTTISKSAFKQGQPLYGYEFDSEDHIGVVPLYLQEPENYWNIHALSWLVSDFLPTDARLQFMQAQQREQLMRQLSRDYTKRFSGIAGGVGAAPAPISDIAVLTPLQFFLVALVGSFSCRDLDRTLVQDWLGAMGPTTVAGIGARELFRTMSQVVPVAGTAVSTGLAAATTYAIGRSAEEYFFNDNVVKPSEFVSEGKKLFGE